VIDFIILGITIAFSAYVGEFDASLLLDVAFHGWVLYYLIRGVSAWNHLRGVDIDNKNDELAETNPE
jgi:hypothetical protein